ncbi:MAG TPA: hypothetical protein VFR13_03425 [Jiangellaceae bacterium]|nr:hypothetical protein [Jiangellaceae bacterium]
MTPPHQRHAGIDREAGLPTYFLDTDEQPALVGANSGVDRDLGPDVE